MNNILILGKWEKAKQAIVECTSVDEVKQIRDQAEALRAYAKQAKESLEVQNNIAEIKLRAERKIGEFSLEVPKSQGQRTDLTSVHDDPKLPKKEILKDAGFNTSQTKRFEQIAKLPEKQFEEHIAKVKASHEELTTIGLVREFKKDIRDSEIQKQRDQLEKEVIEKPSGLFDVIVIDPPWHYGDDYDSETRRGTVPYPTMTQDELLHINIPAKDDSVLFLWTTHQHIWNAYDLMLEWHFDYKATLVWDKEKMGIGKIFRMQCEFCLVGIRGKPFWNLTDQRDIIREARREHSRKPEAFYKMVDRLCAGRKLDYFSREKRKGWEVFGNDTERF